MSHCHNHASCLHTALTKAEAASTARGLRFTEIRRKVLATIWQSHKAVSAAQIMHNLGITQPPVVYRALEFLAEAGFIHHVTSINAYVGCPHPEEPHHSQLLICADCHSVTEIHSPKLETQLAEAAKHHAFTVTEQHVEVLGQCAECGHAH